LGDNKKGRELYKYESRISSLESRLRRIENQIETKEKQLYSMNVSDEKRAEIRSDLKCLDLKYRDVMHELRYLEKSKPAVHTE
jgi:predicted  nucleic acid-binding Zn-ribbon protein